MTGVKNAIFERIVQSTPLKKYTINPKKTYSSSSQFRIKKTEFAWHRMPKIMANQSLHGTIEIQIQQSPLLPKMEKNVRALQEKLFAPK